MVRTTRAVAGALLAWAAAFDALEAQSVLIAPTAIVIDAQRPSASVTLVNTGNAPAEVSLSLGFGLPATDSTGRMYLDLDEAPADSLPSAVGFIHVYPSRLVLPAGARQTVRLVAAPQRPLAAREYWARLIVSSRQGRVHQSHAELRGHATEAQVALDLEVRSVLAVFYRPQGVATALEMAPPRTRIVDGQIETRVHLRRGGNAAFVGSVSALLRDSLGRVRSQTELPVGVYYDLDPLIAMGPVSLPRGTYELELSARAKRSDVPDGRLLPIGAVKQKAVVVVP